MAELLCRRVDLNRTGDVLELCTLSQRHSRHAFRRAEHLPSAATVTDNPAHSESPPEPCSSWPVNRVRRRWRAERIERLNNLTPAAGERYDEGNIAAIDRLTTQGGSRNAALRETNQTAIIVRLLRKAQVMGVRDAICGETYRRGGTTSAHFIARCR